MGIMPDPLRNGSDSGRQPPEAPVFLENLDILRPEDRPAAGIDDEIVFLGQVAAHGAFQFSKIFPAVLLDDLRNRLACPLHDLRVS